MLPSWLYGAVFVVFVWLSVEVSAEAFVIETFVEVDVAVMEVAAEGTESSEAAETEEVTMLEQSDVGKRDCIDVIDVGVSSDGISLVEIGCEKTIRTSTASVNQSRAKRRTF